MSKAEWYGNFDNIARKDNHEEMLLRKEQLQKKFLEMCSKKSSNNISEVKNKSIASIKSKNKKKEKAN